MSAAAPSALVALAVGEERAVVPLDLADSRGIEVETTLPLRIGDALEIQVRCSAGARRVMVEIPVRVDTLLPAVSGRRARLAFGLPESTAVSEILAFAQKLGRRAPEKTPVAPADDALPVRLSAARTTFLVAAIEAGAARLLIDEIAAGSLLVAATETPEKNAEVLVRVALPEGRTLWVSGRVVYHGQTRDGRPGVGLALEPMPDAVRRDLKALRR